MKRILAATASVAALFAASLAFAADQPQPAPQKPDLYSGKFFKSDEAVTSGSVNGIAYQATAGTLVVHEKGWNDSAQNGGDKNPDAKGDEASAEASMFFVYYAKRGGDPKNRPITFLYNGGPGSSTVWLHMGAFGPKRVVTADDSHTPAAPYQLVDNDYSLLDASDLVFIDAPATGFSRIAGKDKEKAFCGVDPDAHAFASSSRSSCPSTAAGIRRNICSAKATARRARRCWSTSWRRRTSVDFNGVILLSQILNFDLQRGRSGLNPGVDLPYAAGAADLCGDRLVSPQAARPAAGGPADLPEEVEQFAMADYAQALQAGVSLLAATQGADRREAARIHRPARRLHPEGRSAHQRRRVREDPAGRRGPDHRAPRHALLRARRSIR